MLRVRRLGAAAFAGFAPLAARAPFADARFFAGFAAARVFVARFAAVAARTGAAGAGRAGFGVGRSPAPVIGSERLAGAPAGATLTQSSIVVFGFAASSV